MDDEINKIDGEIRVKTLQMNQEKDAKQKQKINHQIQLLQAKKEVVRIKNIIKNFD